MIWNYVNSRTRAVRSIVLVIGTIIILITLSWPALNPQEPWRLSPKSVPPLSASGPSKTPHTLATHASPPSSPRPPSLGESQTSQLIRHYIEHNLLPLAKVNDHQYSLFGAVSWDLPRNSNLVWTEPLGEQLCIIDLDDRPFQRPGQIWANTPMTWNKPQHVHGLSLGILNHWLYAKIHGYKYYYVKVEVPPDRHSSWKKPSIISELLRKHKTCVFVDSDAIFHHLDLPFEWLMNYWSLDPTVNSLALAIDPDFPYNRDMFGRLYLNTGFIIAQNNNQTFNILDSWRGCPDTNSSYPGCSDFRSKPPAYVTDQGGFGTYIRYDFPADIKELPCNEANGYPQSESGCDGEFIRHFWAAKNQWLKISVGEQISGDLLETIHTQFLEEKPDFWMTEKDVLAVG